MLLGMTQYVGYVETGFTKINKHNDKCKNYWQHNTNTLSLPSFTINFLFYSENIHYFCELAQRQSSKIKETSTTLNRSLGVL